MTRGAVSRMFQCDYHWRAPRHWSALRFPSARTGDNSCPSCPISPLAIRRDSGPRNNFRRRVPATGKTAGGPSIWGAAASSMAGGSREERGRAALATARSSGPALARSRSPFPPGSYRFPHMKPSAHSESPPSAPGVTDMAVLAPFKEVDWLNLSPRERLARSWAMRSRIRDLRAWHDQKLFPKP